jgi:hypothetical protein
MAVEQVDAQSYRQDLVDAGIVIETEDLWKTYEMGPSICTPCAG